MAVISVEWRGERRFVFGNVEVPPDLDLIKQVKQAMPLKEARHPRGVPGDALERWSGFRCRERGLTGVVMTGFVSGRASTVSIHTAHRSARLRDAAD
jgi:hypothetical protein